MTFLLVSYKVCLMNPISMPATHTLFNMRSGSNLGIYFGKTLLHQPLLQDVKV
jgi:hypothetical protein